MNAPRPLRAAIAFSGLCIHANGQRVATRVDGSLYYVHSDHLGSTVAVSDAAGQALGRVQYDPYGEVLTSTLPVTLTDRLFTGQRFDSSTGLYYYNARYYDPHLGRFIQPDTLVPDPLNPQAWNRFSYVYNNPATYNDPSGHQPLIIGLMLIGAGVFALVVEANQISSYAERHDMSFWEAAVQADTYLDQAAMVEAAVEGALLTLLAAESIPLLLAGGGLVAMQYGVSANNPEIFVRGLSMTNIAAQGHAWLWSAAPSAPSVEELLELRNTYESEVRALDIEVQRRLVAGQSVEEVAEWAHGARRDLGIMFKDVTPPELLEMIYARNIEKYGDPLGPSLEWLYAHGKTPEDIIESATRPGGADIIPKLIEYWENR